jgi:hypothetical protein
MEIEKSTLEIDFINLQKELREIKSHLKQVTLFQVTPIIEEIRKEREQLHYFFLEYIELCRNCQRQYCCRNDYAKHLISGELVYLASIDYIFPQPNWEFLETMIFRGGRWCMFFSPAGCLLKENRRLICFKYICRDLYVLLTTKGQFSYFEQLIAELKANTKILFRNLIPAL